MKDIDNNGRAGSTIFLPRVNIKLSPSHNSTPLCYATVIW